MTSVAPSGTMTLVVSSAVCWFGMLFVTVAGTALGVQLHAHHPVFRDEGANPQAAYRY